MSLKINYAEIIAAGQAASDCTNTFYRRYHGENIKSMDFDKDRLHNRMCRACHALEVTCYVLGVISPEIPVKAARIENEFYERAYKQGRDPGILDAEKLIESLLANQ